ncbi:hypothetical protein GPK63_04055 [Faecalibacterium prausnitzii]|uniref:hypothetical protein n=1 Tax=Faecalibacterium prausnitzii TaxID=853 RepID=UPI001C034CAB|nr:hypothetical protein [Faecalibacterium prausnitzii]MBT9711971.1 hypothetical protein [Faecalibacterium prausnitzii]
MANNNCISRTSCALEGGVPVNCQRFGTITLKPQHLVITNQLASVNFYVASLWSFGSVAAKSRNDSLGFGFIGSTCNRKVDSIRVFRVCMNSTSRSGCSIFAFLNGNRSTNQLKCVSFQRMYSNMIQIQRTIFSKAYDASSMSTSRILRCNIGTFDNSTIAVTPNPNGVVFRFNRNIFYRNIFYPITAIRESESGGIRISTIANIFSTVYSEFSILIINHITVVNSNRILSITINSYTVGFFDRDKIKIVSILRSGYCHISGYIDLHRAFRIDLDSLIVVSVQLILSVPRNGLAAGQERSLGGIICCFFRKCRHCPRRQECQHHTECQ